MRQHVFIIGSKGIPAQYGGFETFVDKLTKYNEGNLSIHVACMSDKKEKYIYNDAECVPIRVPNIGSAKAVYYDCAAIKCFIDFCSRHPEIREPIFYVLACRIGFRIGHYRKEIHRLGGKLYINPDGNEWKRKKWSLPVRLYWKISERYMVKNADFLVCDSVNIEAYIKEEYARYHPRTAYIAYGSEQLGSNSQENLERLKTWLTDKGLECGNYYLMVGRFVPENNYETVIREFMKSNTSRKLAIITGNNSKLMKQIQRRTHFEQDNRICFVGTVYDQDLLQQIRKHAFAYIHGHEVGGTNPSLLEAMSCTDANLLLDVVFNKEVGMDTVLYWNKTEGSLRALVELLETKSEEERKKLGEIARRRMEQSFSWPKIVQEYRELFSADRGK